MGECRFDAQQGLGTLINLARPGGQLKLLHQRKSFRCKNEVTDLYGKEYVGTTTITQEGEQYNSWYGYVADGYFQSREEINNSPVYGGNPDNVKPGYIKYKDISGPEGVPDGKIDSYDRTILGNPTPRYEFGLTLGGDWKGLDFSLFFQGVGKETYIIPVPAHVLYRAIIRFTNTS